MKETRSVYECWGSNLISFLKQRIQSNVFTKLRFQSDSVVLYPAVPSRIQIIVFADEIIITPSFIDINDPKGYCCESEMPLYKKMNILNFVFSLFSFTPLAYCSSTC